MTQSSNQFSQSPELGQIDLDPTHPISVIVDAAQATPLTPGTACKLVDSAQGGIPHIVACTADTDVVFCFIPYNFKKNSWSAGDRVSAVAFGSGTLYLQATAAFVRGTQLELDLAVAGGVKTAASGKSIIGFAFDKAVNVGDLVRVVTQLPSVLKP